MALVLAAGCGDALAFDLTAQVEEFTVPGDPHLHHGGAPLDLKEVPPIDIQLGGIQAGSISLGSLRFFVTDGALGENDEDDVTFLDRVEVRIRPTTAGSELPELLVASWTGPALGGAQEIVLTANPDYELTRYVQEGFSLNVLTFGVVPYDDVSLQGEAVFRVNPL